MLPFFQGGDPTKFRVVNDAYNKLIAHINRLERMEAESELRNTSVIIEISKQAMPKWWEKLKNQYGQPKSSDVKNTLFQVFLDDEIILQMNHITLLYSLTVFKGSL